MTTPGATLEALAAGARALGLVPLGAFHPQPGDGAPPGTGTLILVGPDPAGFWPGFAASPERGDGLPDPLDRWSRRVVTALAASVGAAALFPFDGPPWLPFLAWARRSGRAFASPVGPLVHDGLGLFVSYRGALALPDRLALPEPGSAPCGTCAGQPCRTACPAGALTAAGYDTAACHRFLDTPAGRSCLLDGCAVRRACPVAPAPWPAAQTAFHMAAFHGTQRR